MYAMKKADWLLFGITMMHSENLEDVNMSIKMINELINWDKLDNFEELANDYRSNLALAHKHRNYL